MTVFASTDVLSCQPLRGLSSNQGSLGFCPGNLHNSALTHAPDKETDYLSRVRGGGKLIIHSDRLQIICLQL